MVSKCCCMRLQESDGCILETLSMVDMLQVLTCFHHDYSCTVFDMLQVAACLSCIKRFSCRSACMLQHSSFPVHIIQQMGQLSKYELYTYSPSYSKHASCQSMNYMHVTGLHLLSAMIMQNRPKVCQNIAK